MPRDDSNWNRHNRPPRADDPERDERIGGDYLVFGNRIPLGGPGASPWVDERETARGGRGMGEREKGVPTSDERTGRTYAGVGPKGYMRSDQRILEDVCERLAAHPDIDASEIEVRVNRCEVTLAGAVDDRTTKRLTEDVVFDTPGVVDVHNQLKVRHGFLAGLTGERADESPTTTTNQQEGVSARVRARTEGGIDNRNL